MTKDERIVFLIAGECRDPKEFPGAYSEADLDEMIGGDARIRYTGYVDRVEDVYVSSDIVVVPSRWQEPLGLIAIEAAACPKPVVATRVGGIPEVVLDGVTGYLVEPQDVEQVARRVQELVYGHQGMAAFQEDVARALRGGACLEPVEVERQLADGRRVWVYSSMFPIYKPKPWP